jgi:ABC-type transporter Mla maintaining outer membrane lipid asymmetry permease subunit MlaE
MALALLPEQPLRCLLRGLGRTLLLLPFLALAGFTVGGLALHFVLGNDPLHGAMATTLLAGTGKVLLAVVLPLLGTLLFAAPAVAGTLARVGTLARDRQLAAYRGLGHSVRREVLSPLLWAHLVAVPVAVAGAGVAAIYGAWAADHLARGSTFAAFLPRFVADVSGADLAWALLKCLGSAFLITWVPWHLARGRGLSPRELDEASLRANVYAALGVLLLQGALLFPQLD